MKFMTKDKLVIVPDWQKDTIYKIYNIVLYNNILYRCGTSHKSTSKFQDNYWEPISTSGGGGGGNANYMQITKLNVTAPKTELISINVTNTFAKAPIEVLKFEQGDKDVVATICDFNNDDKTDFNDNDFLTFDGNMSLKTIYDITVKNPVKNGDLYVSESDEFDMSNFKSIESMGVIDVG